MSSKFADLFTQVDPFTYRSKLKDGRMVTLEFTDYGPTQPSESYFGPVRFSVTNHVGRAEVSGIAKLTIPSSGSGTEASNYDATKYGYDDLGRQRRVKEASGTIRRTSFDTLGRTVERWIGTNDSSFAGGESTGTDNMVKTELVEYDGNNDDGVGCHETPSALT